MRKSLFGVGLLGFLFATSPARATIMALLETPDNMQDVSGKSLISGWAFSTMGAPVTVILRINGADTSDTIPCCGPRLDVQNANPGAPLNSGFGRLQNYGVFDPATLNSIGVKITAQGEAPVVIDHQVMVAKPGNAEFLKDFILGPNANIAVDGNEIVIGGAQVNFSGGSAKVNLRVEYATNLQSPVITEAFTDTNAALFNPVQTIFTNRCALSGCHDSVTHQNGQDLSAGNSWKNIVAVRTTEDPSRPRVSPGEDDNSYLYQKIILTPTIPIVGARMPFGCSGNNCLSPTEIKAIENWINDGARPPDGSGGGGGGGGGGY